MTYCVERKLSKTMLTLSKKATKYSLKIIVSLQCTERYGEIIIFMRIN